MPFLATLVPWWLLNYFVQPVFLLDGVKGMIYIVFFDLENLLLLVKLC